MEKTMNMATVKMAELTMVKSWISDIFNHKKYADEQAAEYREKGDEICSWEKEWLDNEYPCEIKAYDNLLQKLEKMI